MTNNEIYRQGDVLITRVEAIPSSAKAQASNVLVEGEVTGHAHRLLGGEVHVVDGTAAMYLVCTGAATVVHEEHHTITLPPGLYQVTRQREYSPEAIRLVAD